MKLPALLVTAIVFACSAAAQTPSGFKLQTRYPVAGVGGWDYITVDSNARRIYVSHGVRVNVLDADTGKETGVVEDTPGIHGIAIAPPSKHGFTKGEVVGTVEVGGNGEGASVDRDGLIYVALEDKNELCAFDPKTLEVKRHIPLDGVDAPTGLAIDAKNDRIFVGGHNKTALVIDGATGKKIASFATGAGTDAAGWDEKDSLAFISNGEGTISVIQEKSANEFVALDPIQTQQSAKTMAFDSNAGKILLPAATVMITPAADPTQKPKRTVTEGTFAVLVVSK